MVYLLYLLHTRNFHALSHHGVTSPTTREKKDEVIGGLKIHRGPQGDTKQINPPTPGAINDGFNRALIKLRGGVGLIGFFEGVLRQMLFYVLFPVSAWGIAKLLLEKGYLATAPPWVAWVIVAVLIGYSIIFVFISFYYFDTRHLNKGVISPVEPIINKPAVARAATWTAMYGFSGIPFAFFGTLLIYLSSDSFWFAVGWILIGFGILVGGLAHGLANRMKSVPSRTRTDPTSSLDPRLGFEIRPGRFVVNDNVMKVIYMVDKKLGDLKKILEVSDPTANEKLLIQTMNDQAIREAREDMNRLRVGFQSHTNRAPGAIGEKNAGAASSNPESLALPSTLTEGHARGLTDKQIREEFAPVVRATDRKEPAPAAHSSPIEMGKLAARALAELRNGQPPSPATLELVLEGMGPLVPEGVQSLNQPHQLLPGSREDALYQEAFRTGFNEESKRLVLQKREQRRGLFYISAMRYQRWMAVEEAFRSNPIADHRMRIVPISRKLAASEQVPVRDYLESCLLDFSASKETLVLAMNDPDGTLEKEVKVFLTDHQLSNVEVIWAKENVLTEKGDELVLDQRELEQQPKVRRLMISLSAEALVVGPSSMQVIQGETLKSWVMRLTKILGRIQAVRISAETDHQIQELVLKLTQA